MSSLFIILRVNESVIVDTLPTDMSNHLKNNIYIFYFLKFIFNISILK